MENILIEHAKKYERIMKYQKNYQKEYYYKHQNSEKERKKKYYHFKLEWERFRKIDLF
jgi:hypothetical protein